MEARDVPAETALRSRPGGGWRRLEGAQALTSSAPGEKIGNYIQTPSASLTHRRGRQFHERFQRGACWNRMKQ